MPVKLSKLKANPDNPRIIKDDKFKKLVSSIQDFPKMMALRPMVIDADGMVLGGNMRLKALQELKFKEVPDEWVKKASNLSPEETKRFIAADNIGFGDWDWDTLANGWDLDELQEWGLDIPDFAEKITKDEASIKLQERFIIPPFSVFDTKQGYWQDRKRLWLVLGIKSELGRGANQIFRRTGNNREKRTRGSIFQDQ